jgi:MYXO-CTERM domain-containing protein
MVATVGVGFEGTSRAAVYSYVNWTEAAPAMGTAKGTITLSTGQTVTVTFAAINADGMPGNLHGAQWMGTGTNYWMPSEPYLSAQVQNAPPDTDILQLAGGMNQTYRVTLSEPIKDPVMAIVSLGAPGTTITYDFDSPFTIVSQGAGYWGGGPMALKQLAGDVLEGTEGHGTIQFIGTFASFSWTVPMPEVWHGFTFAIRTTEALEPPDAGSDAAQVADAAPVADAAQVADAAATTDAAAITDAAPTTDAASITDSAVDAGGKAKSDDCDCALGDGRPGTTSGLPAALVLLAIAGHLRRRRMTIKKSAAPVRSSPPA